MWERFLNRLRGSWLAAWFRTAPLKAMGVVCLACVVVATALGTWVPWPFLQNAAADFVGGTLVGLVIFFLANRAFGFTERRDRERHALKMAYEVLWLELEDNLDELIRVVRVLRAGTLTRSDPVLLDAWRLKVENWQLLIQSPLITNLPTDLVWRIQRSYYVSRRAQKELMESDVSDVARGPQAWKDLCEEYLPRFESAVKWVASAMKELQPAHKQADPGKARRD